MPRRVVPRTLRYRKGRRAAQRRARGIMVPRRVGGFGKPNVYHFKRKVFLQDYLIISTSQALGSIQFALVDLPNSTDFTNLYDQYRFNKVVFKLIPKISESSINPGAITNANLQQIHSVIDHDDNTAPTGINQLVQYQTHKMTRGHQVHTRVLIPKCQATVSGASAAPKAKQWLDCDQNSLAHRGLKFIVPAPATPGTTLYYDLELTYYMSFKAVL